MPFAKGTITNILSPISDSELSIIEIKALRNLTHKTLGLHYSATPDNPKVIAGGGTAIFRKQKLITINEYTKANMYDNGQIPKSEIIKIDASHQKTLKYEIESLDLPQMYFPTRDAFLGYIANSVSISITSYLDAKWLETIINSCKAKYIAGDTDAAIIDADLADLDTKDKREAAYRKVARGKVAISRQVDRYNIGSEFADYGAILHQNVVNDFLLLISSNGGGNRATEIAKNLTESGMTAVAGLGVVKDHIFLNKKIDAGKSFITSGDESFDFTGIFGAIAHKEAVFNATTAINMVSRIGRSGNQQFIIKFNYYGGMVRPELATIITTTAPA